MRTVRMTNTGPACSMYGFPGVSLLDQQGRQLGAPAERETAGPLERIEVTTGSSVHFPLRIVNAMVIDPKICQPTEEARQLRIYPPNDTGSIELPINSTACENEKVVTSFVGSVHPG